MRSSSGSSAAVTPAARRGSGSDWRSAVSWRGGWTAISCVEPAGAIGATFTLTLPVAHAVDRDQGAPPVGTTGR